MMLLLRLAVGQASHVPTAETTNVVHVNNKTPFSKPSSKNVPAKSVVADILPTPTGKGGSHERCC